MIIGIDPGLSGAIAFLSNGLTVTDMPLKRTSNNKKNEVDAQSLSDIVDLYCATPTLAIVEEVGAMPGQGVTSMFSFGKSYGIVLGVLAAHQIPVKLVRPAVWKSIMGVRANKASSLWKAMELFPEHAARFGRMKDDGRAEACLLAKFGERFIINTGERFLTIKRNK